MMKKDDTHTGSPDDIIFEEEKESIRHEKSDALKKHKDERVVCKTERQEYLEGWQRMKADGINLKKEEERKRAEVGRIVKEGFLGDILPVLDSFDMAFKNKAAWESVSLDWRKGVEYIYSQLVEILKVNGFFEIDPAVGSPFDPSRHVSASVISIPEKEKDGTIAAVSQKGYSVGERVVRPARVVIFHYEVEGK